MSDGLWQWPALDLRGRPAPERLEAGRAIWGKVHGAASDFRWIGRSPGLDPQGRRLERELLLGSEDAPARATCWRTLENGYCAVACYPSRAIDATLRSGFLEKQLLAWEADDGAPAALGALTLLPAVAAFDDGIWWGESGNPGWSRPGFSLELGAPSPIPVAPDLGLSVERGRAAIRGAVEESVLAGLYSSLLAGKRPAFLPGLEQPLPPEALAALLLPLPRDLADRLSIAGWVVSQRLDPEAFPRLWDVLVCSRIPAVWRGASEPEVTERGREAALALLTGDPRPLAPRFVAVAAESRRDAPAAAGSSEILDRLLAFATDPGRRWLGPEELAGGAGAPLRMLAGQADPLAGCVQAVQDEISRLSGRPGASSWRREHLQVKADLLRAAALALAPASAKRDGLPDSRRVPALLFCPQLADREWDLLGTRLGEDRLQEAIRQSLCCEPDLFGKVIRNWLMEWRQRTRDAELARLLTQALPAAQ